MTDAELVIERLLESSLDVQHDFPDSEHRVGNRNGSEFSDDVFLKTVTPRDGWNQQSFNRFKLAARHYIRVMSSGDGFSGHDMALVQRASRPEEVAAVLKHYDANPGTFMDIVRSVAEAHR